MARRAAQGLVLAGALLRFARLDARGFWHDEALSMLRAQQPGFAAVAAYAPVVEPPVYTWTLHAWLGMGRDEATARALSAALSAAALALAWRLLCALWPAREALPALALLAFSPLELLYAQQARSYAGEMLLLYAATLALLRATEPRARAPAGPWAVAAAAAAVAGLAHYLALLWLPAAAAFLALSGRGRGRWAAAAGWGAAAAAPVAASAWARRAAIAHTNTAGAASWGFLDWATGLGQHFGAGPWVPGALAGPGLALAAGLALAGLALALASVRHTRPAWLRPGDAALLAFGLLPPLLLYGAHRLGLVYVPKPRYALIAHPFLLAACVRGAGALPGRALRGLALAALLAVEAASAAAYLRGGFPDLDLPPCMKPLRDVAALVRAEGRPGDAVAPYEFYAFTSLKLYLGETYPVHYALPDPLSPPDEVAAVGPAVPLAVQARGHARLWLVVAPVHYYDALDVPADARAILARLGRLESDRVLPGVRVQCWRLRP